MWRTCPTAENSTIAHHINQAIKAHGIMKRDIDYVVKDGEVIIVDEFTGRLMFGRRYSEGLHQAIEAKEHVNVSGESKTLATITFQNYFRLYSKLSGMTGTAMTEERGVRRPSTSWTSSRSPPTAPIVRMDQPGRGVQDRERQVPGRHPAGEGVPREGPARSGGHRVHRKERAAEPRCCHARASSTTC